MDEELEILSEETVLEIESGDCQSSEHEIEKTLRSLNIRISRLIVNATVPSCLIRVSVEAIVLLPSSRNPWRKSRCHGSRLSNRFISSEIWRRNQVKEVECKLGYHRVDLYGYCLQEAA